MCNCTLKNWNRFNKLFSLLLNKFFFLAAASEQANIRAAFADYEKYTCLKFVEAVGSEQRRINIIRDSGCWSYVGNIGIPQNLSLGPGCANVCKNNYIFNSNTNHVGTSYTPAMELF